MRTNRDDIGHHLVETAVREQFHRVHRGNFLFIAFSVWAVERREHRVAHGGVETGASGGAGLRNIEDCLHGIGQYRLQLFLERIFVDDLAASRIGLHRRVVDERLGGAFQDLPHVAAATHL